MTDTTPTPTQEPAMTLAEYAFHAGISTRQLKRWLQSDEVPGAQLVAGRWQIPADAIRVQRLPTRTTPPPVTAVTRTGHDTTTSPLGALGTLQDAAEILGTTVGGVRRLAEDGHLIVGRYGPRGSLRVYLPPKARP